MKGFVTLPALLACVVFSGCAAGYKADGNLGGGFKETQVAADSFRVEFRGNWHTPDQQAADFALLRAAELAQQHGFTHFAVTDENASARIQTVVPPGAYTPESADFNHKTYADNPIYTPREPRTFRKPKAEVVIRCYKTKPDGIATLDAALLEKSMREKYNLK